MLPRLLPLILLPLAMGCAKKPVAQVKDLDGQWLRHNVVAPNEQQSAEFQGGKSKMLWVLEDLKNMSGWDTYVLETASFRIEGDEVHLTGIKSEPIIKREPDITRIELMVESNMRDLAEKFVDPYRRSSETLKMKMISKDKFEWKDSDGRVYVFERAAKGAPLIDQQL